MLNLRTVLTRWRYLAIACLLAAVSASPRAAAPVFVAPDVAAIDRGRVIAAADSFLLERPVTITASSSPRSAGGLHDFFSEGDYWWPDPKNPDGPYIQRDGETNPENFVEHRKALMRFSVQASTLVAAYKISGDSKYAAHAIRHFKAWFVDEATRMSPHLKYAQAIKGKVTGRGTGLIDTIHLIEIAKAIGVLERAGQWVPADLDAVKNWFREYLHWMTTHQYGRDEREAKNNHGTCWVFQVAAYAELVGDHATLQYCRDRFKTVLLPNQLAADGSFPLELKRTKPYSYSLFTLEAFAGICRLLSVPGDNLWTFSLPDGRSMRKAVEYMFPYIADKSKWPLPPDVMHFDAWPMRQSSLLFAGLVYAEPRYIDLWKSLSPETRDEEAIRNYPVRQPVLWLDTVTEGPDVHLVSAAGLLDARQEYLAGEKQAMKDLKYLIRSADKALDVKPLSVTDKSQIPPGGDKHDYMSVAPYWWPDPSKPDGLPYIRRDGERNPDRASMGDRTRIGDLCNAVRDLAFGFYVTRDERYAAHASLLLRAWFIDSLTKMNPNLNYAQAIRGRNEGRGSGIIDSYAFADLVEAVRLLDSSVSFASGDRRSLVAWFDKYLDWLLTSENGRDEADAPNNHGTVYAVQVSSIALFTGRESIARSILDTVIQTRVPRQIDADGREPLELARTKSWGYSLLNLEGLMRLALLGEHFGMDLWSFSTADGRSIARAIDYLLPFGLGKERWPHKQIVPMETERLYPVLKIAAEKYRNPGYSKAADNLPGIEKFVSRGRLLSSTIR